jgi:hypothetical protein
MARSAGPGIPGGCGLDVRSAGEGAGFPRRRFDFSGHPGTKFRPRLKGILMSRLLSASWMGLLLLCGVTLGAGCKPEVKVEPVSGKVTVAGQPLTSGQVSLIPADKEGGGAGMSAGTIDETGTYTIYTAGKAGAPPGDYKVTVTPSMAMPTEGGKKPTMPFNTMYGDPRQTPLTLKVPSSAPGAYDLKLTK